LLGLVSATRAADTFTFAALGCMPYSRYPDSGPSFERVIAEINRHAPVFAVHLGDTIGSDERMTDEVLRRRRDDFNRLTTALIYTPGDNEWTDASRPNTGGFDPIERLTFIRQLYFATERSLGRNPLPLITQRREPAHAKFVENARWNHHGVLFATVHVVGSQNNHQANVPGAIEEWRERDAANAAWVRATFAEARTTAAKGVAFFFQADPFAADRGRPGYDPGFEPFLKTLETEARAFAKPVLLVHADEHRYRLDAGLQFQAGAEPLSNVTRLETFGAQNFHAVIVAVDPASIPVFVAGPLLVPGNRLPELPRHKAPAKK
jgi:hypothetical protein